MTDTRSFQPMPDRGLSIHEAYAALGIKRTSLYGLIKNKKLRPLKIGSRTIIPASQIAALLSGGEK